MQVLILKVINLGLTLLLKTGESRVSLIKIQLKGHFDSCSIHISGVQKPQLISSYWIGQH